MGFGESYKAAAKKDLNLAGIVKSLDHVPEEQIKRWKFEERLAVRVWLDNMDRHPRPPWVPEWPEVAGIARVPGEDEDEDEPAADATSTAASGAPARADATPAAASGAPAPTERQQ